MAGRCCEGKIKMASKKVSRKMVLEIKYVNANNAVIHTQNLVTGILAKISLGTGIWAKFGLGTGIWYPPSRPSIQLFSAVGVKGVSIQDIDTAHRVPSMKPSNRPKAIICKFVRRLAKDQVMAARKKVGGLKAKEREFAADINVKYLNIYDHLMPRLQVLHHEGKKVKEAK